MGVAEDGYRVFVSAVTEELGAWRGDAVAELRRKELDVRDQDHFRQAGATLLVGLEDYIKKCDAVVCLVGRTPGSGEESYPSEDHVKSIGAIPV